MGDADGGDPGVPGPVPLIAMKKISSTQKSADAVHENWHLGGGRSDVLLTELELVMLRFQQAFERWVQHVTARCGESGLSFSENVLLHAIRLQSQACTTQSISRLLNRDDIPNVQYSLRKLVKAGYLTHVNAGAKNNSFALTERAYQLTDDYAEIRHAVLVAHTPNLEAIGLQLQTIIDQISALTGQYDEAMRKASTYSFPALGPRTRDTQPKRGKT